MSQPLHLAPGVHVARLGERFVVLDRRADDYSCLVGPAAAALRDLLDERREAQALAPLVDAGLLVRGPGGTPSDPPPLPGQAFETEADVTPRPGAVAAALGALAATSLELRVRRFDRICARLERQPAGSSSSSAPLAARLAAFDAARRWYPRTPMCLFDGLALARFLRGQGVAARLVFGVRLDPFGAHCWIEHDGLLLRDRLATVQAFTPIMAI